VLVVISLTLQRRFGEYTFVDPSSCEENELQVSKARIVIYGIFIEYDCMCVCACVTKSAGQARAKPLVSEAVFLTRLKDEFL